MLDVSALVGFTGNLLLQADAGADVLTGRNGNDLLLGGTGSDSLLGGLGSDTLQGGDSIDTVSESGDVNFTLTDTSLTGMGLDVLSGVEQAILLGGSRGNKINAAGFTLGAVTLDGGGGSDQLTGGSSNDSLIGGAGIDTLAESGDVNFTLTDSSLTGMGIDVLSGVEQAILFGGSSGNKINAAGFTLGAVTLDGGGGSDQLTGGSSNDSLIGGAGIDTLAESGDVNFTLTDTNLAGNGIDVLSGVEQAVILGGSSGNKINAAGFTLGAVTLDGGGGSDQLTGGSSNDSLIGGFGDDSLVGGAGSDTVSESADVSFTLTDTSLLGLGADVLGGIEQAILVGGSSGNKLDAGAFTLGSVTLDGGAGDDVLVGGGSSDRLLGGSGNDALRGSAGDDNLDGSDGLDQVVEFADVNMTLTNTGLVGLGNDVLIGIEQASLTGGESDNKLDASAFALGSVTLDGAAGNDALIGSALADSLVGGTGDDSFIGGLGDDSFVGGGGTDALMESADVSFTLTDSSLTGQGNDVLNKIEQVSLTAGASANVFTVSGFTGSATLSGGGNSDSVLSGLDADFILTDLSPSQVSAADGGRAAGDQSRALLTVSNSGSFTLFDILNVHLTGGAGKNSFTITNFSGQAKVDGGGSDDRVSVHAPTSMTLTDTSVVQADGKTLALTSIERASLAGGAGDEVLDASAFTLGSVTLDGAAGSDTLIGGILGDSLIGGDGHDDLRGGDGLDILAGGSGRDIIKGGQGADSLLGGSGNDSLIGGTGADFLNGNDGRDTVNGGPGNDRCRNSEVSLGCP